MELELKGLSALITGASQGVGYAIAEGLAKEGVNLSLVARSVEALETAKAQLLKDYDVSVQTFPIDLAIPGAIPQLVEFAGDVDILINNAGDIPAGSLESVSEESWRAAWDVKVFGYINMTRAFYGVMKDRNSPGVIINVTGLSGIKLGTNYIAGSTGNACLETFTRTAGAYSLDHGVRILAVSPGAVQTERIVKLLKYKAQSDLGDSNLWEKYLVNFPLKRAATAEEVANLVVFLSSNKASYINGVVYHVDGGHNARGSSFS